MQNETSDPWADVPTDLATNHDHYLYGHTKKPEGQAVDKSSDAEEADQQLANAPGRLIKRIAKHGLSLEPQAQRILADNLDGLYAE